jgi:hypothetical protein
VVEDVDFRATDAAPVIRPIIHALLGLQAAVRELDSKRLVLSVLVALLHGTHEIIGPLIGELVPVLASLWHMRDSPEPIFRGAVVQALTELVEVVDVASADSLSGITIPIARQCFVGPGADVLVRARDGRGGCGRLRGGGRWTTAWRCCGRRWTRCAA